FFVGVNSEIRFFAPESWRSRVRTSEVRHLLSQYRGGGLAPDPGSGQFQAKVLLNRELVRRLADASGYSVSGFLRCLLAPRMPHPPIRKPLMMALGQATAPALRAVLAPSEYVPSTQMTTDIPRSLSGQDERKVVAAFCSQCGGYRDGKMAGVPTRFRCLSC